MTNSEIITEIEKLLVKLKGEEKKTRKLATILDETADSMPNFHNYCSDKILFDFLAKAAIDAVVECFHDWTTDYPQDTLTPFPEYLKEKML